MEPPQPSLNPRDLWALRVSREWESFRSFQHAYLVQKGRGSLALGSPLPELLWRMAFAESGRGLLERGQPHGTCEPGGGTWVASERDINRG